METCLHETFIQSLPTAGWARYASAGVVVAFARTDDWRGWLPALSQLLDSAESARMGRKRRQLDRETLQLAYGMRRLLLAEALQDALPEHIPPELVSILRTPSGQPRIGDAAGWSTSLSHARDAVAIAVGKVELLGVDLEDLDRADAAGEIQSQVLHIDDPRLLQVRTTDGLDGLTSLELWVRKESLLKAAGTGLAIPMTSFAVPLAQRVPLPGDMTREAEVRMLDAPAGLLAAVATPPATAIHSAFLVPRH